MLRLLGVSLLMAVILTPVAGWAQPGGSLFEEHCAPCHGSPEPGSRAPDREALRQFTPERVLESLTTGAMSVEVPGLTDEERREVAQWAAGRALGTAGGDASSMPNRCPSKPFGDPFAGAGWNGWGPDGGNSRFQPAAAAGLTADQVPRLTLKWAFGYPGGVRAAAGSPTVVGGRLYAGSDTGYVYSLDAASGCVYWSFESRWVVRSSVTIGPVTGAGTARYAAYFGDARANVYAVNAETGELLWKQRADTHPIARITAAPKLHAGRLYVPVSSLEELAGRHLWYECCTFRGSVVAYDANTGEQIWKSYAIAEEPRPTTKNAQGTQQWAPAGGAVWGAPVIDAARGALYIGSGNGYTAPAANDTDAVIAFDLETGKRLWLNQLTAMDAYLSRCPGRIDVQGRARDPKRADPQRIAQLNCPDPEKLAENVDVDVVAVMLHALPDGRTILVVGQQNGRVYALDPDREGAVLWELYAGADTEKRANITFGGATDGRLAYFPLLYQPSEHRGISTPSRTKGAMAAIRAETGERVWYTPTPPANCPDPSPQRCGSGLDGAATVIPGVVFAGAMDGMLRAYSTTDGRIIWEVDTAQEFETVNDVPARGGMLNGPGPTVVDGMLFTGSGYASGTGNVLLAFGLE
ncbi:MAG: PQQ-binding-like beta-propeller repeat protein [Acidobacteria bacterium]|nr:PQQ-binding-like beta-propeller repeat protein [Acidobacteriota bacterium]